MPPSLKALQQSFAEGVFDPSHEKVLEAIDTSQGLSAGQHLQIYRNNTLLTLTGALQSIYPVICRLVGERFFRYAADVFICQSPPQAGDLHDYGEGFAAFLSGFPPAQGLPYLADVARLEWACHEAYHAEMAPPVTESAWYRFSEKERKAVQLHPAVRLMQSEFPVFRIWEINQAGYEGEDTVSLDEGGDRVMVLRPKLEVMVVQLAEAEMKWLQEFADTNAGRGANMEPEWLERHLKLGSLTAKGAENE